MITYRGQFTGVEGTVYSVVLRVPGDDVTVDIGNNGLFFADDPVNITTETVDVMEPVVRQSATLRLLTNRYISGLFARDVCDVTLTVSTSAGVLFAGFLEPMAFSQPFNEVLDELELPFIDILSALQHRRWRGVYSEADWADALRLAEMVTFDAIVSGCTRSMADLIPLPSGKTWRLLWDGSKAPEGAPADRWTALTKWSVSELVMLGDSVDDVWSELDALTEACRWMGVRIVQDGCTLRVYDRRTAHATAFGWRDLWHNNAIVNENTATMTLSLANVGGADAQISIGEAFNRVKLTAELDNEEVVIESPMEDAIDLYEEASNTCTVYWSKCDNKMHASLKFALAVCPTNPWLGNPTGADQAMSFDGEVHKTDWFVRLLRPRRWVLPWLHGSRSDVTDLCKNDDQNWLPYNVGCADGMWCHQPMMLSVASGEIKLQSGENQQSSLDWKDILVLPVNARGTNDEMCLQHVAASMTPPVDPSTLGPYVSGADWDRIIAKAPLAVFDGGVAVPVSPVDEGTTNYLVISGTLTLRGVERWSCNYSDACDVSMDRFGDPIAIPVEDPRLFQIVTDDHGREILACETATSTTTDEYKYRGIVHWASQPVNGVRAPSDANVDFLRMDGWYPMDESSPKSFKYEYNEDGSDFDKINKVNVLCCMLRVGNKVCVEDIEYGTGMPYNFHWQTYKTLEECGGDLEEYYAQSIHIGVNPKIGETVIGQERPIANNIGYALNLDCPEGMAIPVTAEDGLEGPVHFEILYVEWMEWQDTWRKHSTWFSDESWRTDPYALLNEVKSVELADLKVGLYSDNGGARASDNDLVYLSETDEAYHNEFDDLSVRFTSALTTEESKRMGVYGSVCRSTVCCAGKGVTAIHDVVEDADAKAEKLVVDAAWNALHTPHVSLDTPVVAGAKGWMGVVTHPALPGRQFEVLGIDRNLRDETDRLKLREF